jgi:uncharacterized protein HemX
MTKLIDYRIAIALALAILMVAYAVMSKRLTDAENRFNDAEAQRRLNDANADRRITDSEQRLAQAERRLANAERDRQREPIGFLRFAPA